MTCRPRRCTLAAVAATLLLAAGACGPRSTSAAQPSGGNLVKNSGFEERSGDAPAGWTFEARASGKGAVDTVSEGAHSGRALRLSPNDRNRPWDIASHPLSIGQAFPAAPYRGRRLYIAAWLAARGEAVAVASLIALQSDGGVVIERLEQKSSPEPVLHRGVLEVPNDSKVQYIVINCAVEGTGGSAFFDDIVVSTEPPSGAAPAARSAAAGPLRAEVVVDAGSEVRRIPRGLFGTNLEWVWDGDELWDAKAGRLDPDLIELTREAGLSVLRFPGGVFADFYNWRDGVGPQNRRPETPHTRGEPRSVHRFGTDEALDFASAVGGELLITVNAGTGSAADAAGWVRHVNGGGRRRVRYWEVGNELYIADPKFVSIQPGEYVKRLREFAAAMKAADSGIQVGGIIDENYGRTAGRSYRNWTDAVLKEAADVIDFVAVHNAYAPMLVADRGWDVRTVYGAMLAAPVLIRENLDALNRRIEALGGRGERLRIAVTEWGPFFHFDLKNRFVDHVKTLGSALFTASAMNVLLASPRVDVANYFKLIDPLFMGLIGRRGNGHAPTASYLALQLYTRHFGETLLRTDTKSDSYTSEPVGWVDRVQAVPYLDTVASRSADGRTLYVLAVNKHLDQPITAQINLRGFRPEGSATAWTVNGTAVDAHTGTRPIEAAAPQFGAQASVERGGRFRHGGPDEVTLTSAPLSSVTTAFEYTFPAHSITSLEIRGRRP